MTNKIVQKAITKAVSNLIFGEPFIGSLLPRMTILILPADKFPSSSKTAATDGKNIYCCEEFFLPLNDFEINGVLAHECFHCFLLHFCRQGDRIPEKWNAACDYALNPFVLEMGRCSLPGKPLVNDRFKNMTAERIYDLLEDDEWDAQAGCDLVPNNMTPEEQMTAEIEWRGAVAVAAQQAKQAGTMTADLEAMIELLLKPKVPWFEVLWNFMVRPLKTITQWNRINRRYRHQGLKFPAKKVIKTGIYVTSYDVSRSMSDKAVEQCLSEQQYIINIIKPLRVIMIEHDYDIKHIQVFERGDELPSSVTIHGRGGTSFLPVFEYVNSLDEPPEALILLTDGYGPYPEEAPDYPVLWILCGCPETIKMPYGEQIWIGD